jgi:hypothetical protein
VACCVRHDEDAWRERSLEEGGSANRGDKRQQRMELLNLTQPKAHPASRPCCCCFLASGPGSLAGGGVASQLAASEQAGERGWLATPNGSASLVPLYSFHSAESANAHRPPPRIGLPASPRQARLSHIAGNAINEGQAPRKTRKENSTMTSGGVSVTQMDDGSRIGERAG